MKLVIKAKVLSCICLASSMICASYTTNGKNNPTTGLRPNQNSVTEVLPYQNPELSSDRRAEDLLSRMSIEEKIAQISHLHSWNVFDGKQLNHKKLSEFCGDTGFGFFEGFPLTAEDCRSTFREIQEYMIHNTRLGIPAFPVAESLHGVVHEGATIYPQNIALGSTFNQDLAYKKAQYISGELNTMGVRQVLAPCIDVVRELRWGRVEESYSEDPFLCSEMAVGETKGYLDHGISPMLKHYGPHGNPQSGLNLASVDCGTRDLFDIYLKPFEKVIAQTDIKAIMSSYNAWNRTPNSASHFMMTEVLRNRFGFKGYVYSDWGVVDMLKTFHHTAANDAEAAYQALSAGLDVEASSSCFQALPELIRNNQFDIRLIDQAVLRVLTAKFDLGLFEDPFQENAEWKLPLMSEESVQISRQIADESIVLLENKHNTLPLNRNKLHSIAVIGPNADKVQFGDYTWSKNKTDGVTPLQGIRNLLRDQIKVNYATGCGIASLDESGIPEAVEAARKSDVSIVFVGSSSTAFVRHSTEPSTSGEGIDLNDISLTGAQQALLEAVKATGKPLVVVLVAGKPFAIPWVKENADAALVQWYGGQEEGNSIASVLFGDVNPSGKLSFSFPQSTGHLPVFYNHLSTDRGFYKEPGTYEHPGRDYVFSNPDPVWAFGHGLSYTDFEYTASATNKKVYNIHDTLKVSVSVKNVGKVSGNNVVKIAGKEVVQLYVRDVVSSVMTPVKQLKAFKKISLEPGETKTITLEVPMHELWLTDEQGNRFAEDGEYEIMIGSASDDIRLRHSIVMSRFAGQIGDLGQSNELSLLKDLSMLGENISADDLDNMISADDLANMISDCNKAGDKAGKNSGDKVGKNSGDKVGKNTSELKSRTESGKIITIKGWVRDVQATPVKGVKITDGTGKYSCQTDATGAYTIKAHSQGTITFTRKGYKTTTLPVNNQKEISLQLKKQSPR